MYVCVNTDNPNDDDYDDDDVDGGGNNAGAISRGIIGGIMGLMFISSLTTLIII